MRHFARLIWSTAVIATTLAGGQSWAQDAASAGLTLARFADPGRCPRGFSLALRRYGPSPGGEKAGRPARA